MDQERADKSGKAESASGGKQSSDGATSTSKLDTKGEAEPPPLSTSPGAVDGAGQGAPVSSSSDLARETPPPASENTEPPAAVSDARVAPFSPVAAPLSKITRESVRDVLGKFGKKVVEATKQAEDLAGNVWQHLKTGPSIADAAMGRIAQGTKVIAEGGYERIFRQTFDTLPEEQLEKSYACYLSTSAGPVMGILYLSSAKLAFCSDNPLSYKVGDQTEWSYYKAPEWTRHSLEAMMANVCATAGSGSSRGMLVGLKRACWASWMWPWADDGLARTACVVLLCGDRRKLQRRRPALASCVSTGWEVLGRGLYEQRERDVWER